MVCFTQTEAWKVAWKFTTIKLIFSRFCEYTNIFASGDDWIKHEAFSFSRTNINPGCKACRIKVGLLVHYLKLDIVDQCIFVPAVHCNPAFISSIFRGPGFIDIKSSVFSHFQQSDLFNWHLNFIHSRMHGMVINTYKLITFIAELHVFVKKHKSLV